MNDYLDNDTPHPNHHELITLRQGITEIKTCVQALTMVSSRMHNALNNIYFEELRKQKD